MKPILHTSSAWIVRQRSLFAWVGLVALLLVAAGTPAKAALIQNGNFEQTSLATTNYVCAQDGSMTCTSRVTGWSSTCVVFGCVPDGHDVLFEVFPSNITGYNSGTGLDHGHVTASPAGGNFIAEDGSTSFDAPLSQTVAGLTPGATYALSFYQAGAEQGPGGTATTEQWQVSLGGEVQDSAVMDSPADSWSPWESQTLTFTATAASEVLTFLALGTPNGAPPVALLDGVSLNQVPEPASWALLVTGLAATIGAASLLRRKSQRLSQS